MNEVRLTPYYDAGGITLYHGDCLDILPSLAGPVDHTITDPPYEIQAHTLQRRARVQGVVEERPISFPPIDEQTRSRVAGEIGRLTRRWVLCFCQFEAGMKWASEFENMGGLEFIRPCVWVKPNCAPQFTGDRPAMGFETIIAMHRPGRKRWNGGGHRNVFTYDAPRGGPDRHETQKPIKLMRELVTLFTEPGEMILDPFAGSGSTLVAAKDLGRRAIGIERQERYCEIAVRRLESGPLFSVKHEQTSFLSVGAA